MLITRQDILLQNQRDYQAFQEFTQAMREMLIDEMEASRRQSELRGSFERVGIVVNQAA